MPGTLNNPTGLPLTKDDIYERMVSGRYSIAGISALRGLNGQPSVVDLIMRNPAYARGIPELHVTAAQVTELKKYAADYESAIRAQEAAARAKTAAANAPPPQLEALPIPSQDKAKMTPYQYAAFQQIYVDSKKVGVPFLYVPLDTLARMSPSKRAEYPYLYLTPYARTADATQPQVDYGRTAAQRAARVEVAPAPALAARPPVAEQDTSGLYPPMQVGSQLLVEGGGGRSSAPQPVSGRSETPKVRAGAPRPSRVDDKPPHQSPKPVDSSTRIVRSADLGVHYVNMRRPR